MQIDNKSQVIGNTAVDPSIITSQPLTSFYKAHSSSLQKKTFKVIPTKKCVAVTPTTISNSPLVQVTSSSSMASTLTPPKTACGTFQQKIQQNKKTVANSSGAVCKTIVIDNINYQLIKDTSGQLRAVFMPTCSVSPLAIVTASSSDTAVSAPTITTCQSVNGLSGQMRVVDNDTLISPPTVIIRVCKILQYIIFINA